MLAFGNPAFANTFKFKLLNSSNGLPQSSIRAITEDQNGFLWLGTEGGLVRYDGINLKVYRNDFNNPNSLPENIVLALLVDSNNLVWIGTAGNGLSVFDPATENFHSFSTGISGDVIKTLALTSSGDILVGAKNGLFLASNKPESLAHFSLKPLLMSSRLKDAFYIVGLWEDKNQQIWIATNHGYLFYLDAQRNLIQVGGKHADSFVKMRFSRQHGLLVAAAKQGLLQVDLNKHTVRPILESTLPKNSIIYDVIETKNKTLWIASNIGLIQWKKGARQLSIIRSNINDEHSLSQNDIRSLFVSKNDMLWVGTKTKGLNSLNLKHYGFYNIPPFRQIQVSIDSEKFTSENELVLKQNLDDSTIWSIFKDHDKGLWIGSNKGLNYKAYGDTSFKFINRLGIADKAVYIDEAMAITEADGLMWIGTYNKGLISYSPSNNNITHYSPTASNEKNRISGKIIRLLKYDAYRHCIWVGTKQNGLNRIDLKTGNITQFKHLDNDTTSLPHNSIRALYIAPDNRLWVGTGDGLSLYNDKTQTFTSLTYASGLSDEDVRAFYQSDKNTLWVATSNGINKISIKPFKVLLRLGEKQGLADSTTYTLIPDDSGYLWITTLNGLSRFDPKALTFSNFYAYQGLQDNEFNFNAWYKDAENRIYIGGVNGVSYFNPADISNPYTATKPIILSIDAYDSNLLKYHQKSMISQSIKEENKIILGANLRRLNIDFSSAEFIAPQHVRYRYRLKGFESDWNYTDISLQKAVYTNLDQGSYLFELESFSNSIANSGNNISQNNPGISIPIFIKAYFWETFWFKVLLGLLSAIILWGIFISRERHVRKRAIDGERLQHYRKVVHELKTPLIHVQSLLARLDNTCKKNTDGDKLFDSIQRNINRSLHFIDQLHSVVKLNSKQIETIQDFLLEELVDEAILSFSYRGNNKLQERLKILPYDKDTVVRTFEESIYLVLSNLISNALKYSPSDSLISLKITVAFKDLIIECIDQGTPISKAVEKTLYQPYTRFNTSTDVEGLGLGLSIVKQVVEYHQGSILLDHQHSQGNHFIIKLSNIVVTENFFGGKNDDNNE